MKRSSATSAFAARWGGTCFDMSVPAAREYVRSVVARISHDWGYGYFKMDGLWTGTATRRFAESSKVRSNHWVAAVKAGSWASVITCLERAQMRSARMGFRL